PHRQYYNIPVKFYNPARKTGSSSGGSGIDSSYSPPQPHLAKSKNPISSPGNSEAIILNAHQSQAEKAEHWKGALEVHYQKKIDSDTPKSVSGDKNDNEASPLKPFRMSDIQTRVAKPDTNVQVEVVTSASPPTNVVAEDEKG